MGNACRKHSGRIGCCSRCGCLGPAVSPPLAIPASIKRCIACWTTAAAGIPFIVAATAPIGVLLRCRLPDADIPARSHRRRLVYQRRQWKQSPAFFRPPGEHRDFRKNRLCRFHNRRRHRRWAARMPSRSSQRPHRCRKPAPRDDLKDAPQPSRGVSIKKEARMSGLGPLRRDKIARETSLELCSSF